MQQSAESAILDYFGSATTQFEDERQIIGAIIRQQVSARGHVNNKIIILRLIEMLESCKDVVQQDILRNALEIVLGQTEDDTGF